MSYFVTLSFDLAGATFADYSIAYADLARIGLHNRITSSSGDSVVLPTTTCAGEFQGSSGPEVSEFVHRQVWGAFTARGFAFEIFVSVGADWAWVHNSYPRR